MRAGTKDEGVPIGLIEAAWGGTVIEAWIPIEDQYACTGRLCEDYFDRASNTVGNKCDRTANSPDSQPAGLWNGMVNPLKQMAIFSALWYQGENNGANPGDFNRQEGYACLLPRMVESWRREFSTAGLTDESFPFGVISMHAWCGEEESNCEPGYPNGYPGYDNPLHTATQYTAQMRWYGEQAGQPTVPNPSLPGVYLTQTYDIGDPQWCYATTPYGNCSSVGLAQDDPKCFCPQPPPLMGDIHPRNKLEVGRRVAMSLLALMSDATRTKSIGAVFESCTVDSTGEINVTFAQSALTHLSLGGAGGEDSLAVKHPDGFEVQQANGSWLPVAIAAHAGNSLQLAPPPQHRGILLGLRYAWRDHACCPRFYSAEPEWSNWALKDREHPVMNGACPPKNCSVYTQGSELPATPFTVAMGPPRGDGAQRCAEFASSH